MVSWDSNMDILLLILTLWLSGRHSSEILPMEQPSSLIILLSVEKLSGVSNLELSFLCLMVWMGKDLNIVKLEYKDFCSYLMTTAISNKLSHWTSNSDMETFKSSTAQLHPTISML